MGFIRFWKRIKILPGILLNIGKKGISFSFGPKGIKFTKGTSGERFSVGVPETGVYYVEQMKKNKSSSTEIIDDQTLEDLKKEIKGK